MKFKKVRKALYSLYCVISFVLLFLLIFPFFLILSFFGRIGEKGIWFLIKTWSCIWLFIIGHRVKVEGWDSSYYQGQPLIVVANHQSYLDTAMIFRVMPFMVAPLAKYELSKIPLFGLMYKKMAVLINREDSKSKKEGYTKLKKSLQQTQKSILIFPEGTFSQEGGTSLLPFYNGAFRLAIEMQLPILPILFLDTRKRFNEQKFWEWSPGVNRVVFLPPTSPPKDLKSLESYKMSIFEEMNQVYFNQQ